MKSWIPSKRLLKLSPDIDAQGFRKNEKWKSSDMGNSSYQLTSNGRSAIWPWASVLKVLIVFCFGSNFLSISILTGCAKWVPASQGQILGTDFGDGVKGRSLGTNFRDEFCGWALGINSGNDLGQSLGENPKYESWGWTLGKIFGVPQNFKILFFPFLCRAHLFHCA